MSWNDIKDEVSGLDSWWGESESEFSLGEVGWLTVESEWI